MSRLNADTQRHIDLVRRLLRITANELLARGETHDQSKFSPEEADVFDEYSPKLSGMTYGSDEYRACLAAMKPALDHHYANNRHHPEHFPNGVQGMNLIDLLEMFVDWTASGRRHADGNIHWSIEVNAKRFELPTVLADILHNTARDLETEFGIENRLRGRCGTCRHRRFEDSHGLIQCALTSAPMKLYDGCEEHSGESDAQAK